MESIINNLPIKLLTPEAKSPKRSSEFAAGLDLYTTENIVLKSKTLTCIKTGVAMQIPKGCYG